MSNCMMGVFWGPRRFITMLHGKLDQNSSPKIEVLNGVNRQSSNGLKGNRQPSKKVIFYCHKYKLILTFKEFQGISNLTSADLHGLLAPEESLNFSTFSKHSL